jgi:hypothetical protein
MLYKPYIRDFAEMLEVSQCAKSYFLDFAKKMLRVKITQVLSPLAFTNYVCDLNLFGHSTLCFAREDLEGSKFQVFSLHRQSLWKYFRTLEGFPFFGPGVEVPKF